MSINISNFFGAYPAIKESIKESNKFQQILYQKNEFYENRLNKYEEKPTKPGTLMKHQKNISRYLSGHTLYDSLLAVHQPGTGKCVHPDTKITMANGDIHAIKNLWFYSNNKSTFDGEGGEWNVPIIPLYVLSYDSNTNTLVERKILKLYREIFKDYLVCITLSSDLKIKLTNKHRLLTTRGWIEAKNISENDRIINANKEEITVKNVTHNFYTGLIYDLEIDGTHTYIANNLISHNTCSAVATAEQIRNENSSIKRTLVLFRGKALIENFINELVFVCTKGQYIPEDYASLTELEKVIRVKKKISDFYTFETFEIFSKKIQDYSDITIRENYNNSLIVIDEVHNLRYQGEEKNIYNNIHRFLHAIENYKILLLSGTPMKDQPQEIATVMNLILPINFQLPIEDEFNKKFLVKQKDNTYTINDNMKIVLKSYFKGRVSYLKAMKSDVKKEFQGDYLYNLEKLKVYPDYMSKFQEKSYKKAYEKDKGEEAGIYSNSRQASLFVFPDESYGQEGFKKYITEKKGIKEESTFTFSLTSEFKQEFDNLSKEEKFEKLSKFSKKYANTIRLLLKDNESCFVYCDFVEGSGAILFSKLLELFGFSKSTGNTTTKGLRYSIITNKTTSRKQIRDILKDFNDPKNKFGEYIKVIIGSRVIGEGFSLKNIQQAHILTPYWNYSETDQAIARAIRLFSHKDLEEAGFAPILRIYQHVSLSKNDKDSIDLIMYSISEKKDISIKQIERLIKESSFDCALNYERNILPPSENNSRDCEYTVCKYKCDGISENEGEVKIDYDTYNLYYAKEKIPEIKDMIKKFFSEYFVLKFEFILETLNKYSVYEVLLALKEIVNNSEIIIDKYGFNAFLKEQNNSYYLDSELFTESGSNYLNYFYTENPTVFKDVNFRKIINEYYAEKLPEFIDKLFEEKETDKKGEILRKLPILVQELLLESCYIAKDKKVKENIETRDFILNYYAPYIYEINNKVVSSLLLKQMNILKCYNKKEITWNECDISYIDKLKSKLESQVDELKTNPYGYYGIYIQEENKFLIRDTSEGQKTDKREETRGRVCLTWDKSDIIKLIMKLEFDYDVEKVEKEEKLSKQELIELISKKYKYALKTYTLSEIERMNKQTILRLLFWSSKSKNIICKEVENWFRNKNLLQIV